MAIEIDELNKWIDTDEGKRWGDEFKSALLKNRDSLLSELKSTGGKLSETEQRLVQTENELSAEKAALSKFLIDDELNRLLKNCHVFEALIPSVVENLKNAHGITVLSNGQNRTATGKMKNNEGGETEATLQVIVDTWKGLPESKQIINGSVNTGGGAAGSTYRQSSKQPSLNNLSGRQLASMPDSEFEALRQQQLTQT